MSDTAEVPAVKTTEVTVQQERRTRKVPAIVIDRPSLQPARVVFFTLVGAGIGVGLGLLSAWYFGQAATGGEALPGADAGFLPPYTLPFLITGVAAGLAYGLLEGRAVTPRRDTVEIEVGASRLRRSSSTALQRRD